MMKLKILCASLAAVAAAGCVYHHEVKSAPDRDRMEFALKAVPSDAKAVQAGSIGRHD